MKHYLLLAFLLLLPWGCADQPILTQSSSPSTGITMGEVVDVPGGFKEFCLREPTATECGK